MAAAGQRRCAMNRVNGGWMLIASIDRDRVRHANKGDRRAVVTMPRRSVKTWPTVAANRIGVHAEIFWAQI
jgi:hypothetical protein